MPCLPTITRRDALGLCAAAASAAALPRADAAAAAPVAPAARPRWKTAIGLNGFQSGTHKYKKIYPLWEVLDFASRNRFNGVELVSDWPSGGYPGSSETQRIKALRRLYDLYGLQIFSIQLGADGAFDPDNAVRARWLEQFRDRAKFAKAVGCDCVGMWPGGGLRGQTIDQALDRLAGTFRRAGEIAGDLGLLAASCWRCGAGEASSAAILLPSSSRATNRSRSSCTTWRSR